MEKFEIHQEISENSPTKHVRFYLPKTFKTIVYRQNLPWKSPQITQPKDEFIPNQNLLSIAENDEEFPSFFSESDYNFKNLMTTLNTIFNENPEKFSREFVIAMNNT